MTTNRLEAFSDGVLAIIITIMVLELRPPEGSDLAALWHTTGLAMLTYILSFVYVGIYWNNHHHLFQVTDRVNGAVLWANLHLLFWLSLLPFTTTWMDDSHLAGTPVLVYGLNLLAAALAFTLLQRRIIADQGEHSPLEQLVGRNLKGRASLALYLAGILSSALIGGANETVGVSIALACFVAPALLWLVPDQRIERHLDQERVEDNA